MKAQKLTSETILDLGIGTIGTGGKQAFPDFGIGDTIAVHQFVTEGDKERVQIFEGDVIAIRHKGASGTFTVRKVAAHNVAVERVFPYYSPIIKSINIVRVGKSRRAKAYYVRARLGKSARFSELVLTKEQKVLAKEHEHAKKQPDTAPE